MSASKVAARTGSARALWPADEVHEAVRRRSVSSFARKRLADAIRSVALDICGDPDHLSPADRQWIRQALAEPVNEATEEALRVLVQELSTALRSAPGRVRPALVTAPPVSRTDFE